MVSANYDHRLNGSSSPVLTATCLSYGSLCDFLTFSPTDLEVSPQPILTQNGSNDVDSRKDVPFAVKIGKNFIPPAPSKRSKFGNFLDYFRSISRLTLGSHE